MALNEDAMKLEPRALTNAFCTGTKPVFKLRTKLGRTIRATGNHKFRTFAGWRRLDELAVGDALALPRSLAAAGRAPTMTGPELALLGHLIGDGCTLPNMRFSTRPTNFDWPSRSLSSPRRSSATV